MTPLEYIAAINALLGIAYQLHETLGQISGDQPIPTWDDLASQNAILQRKIDAEK